MHAISMFYGIVIFMFLYEDNKPSKPHVHASYGEDGAMYSIEDGELLEGKIPMHKQKLVQAWIEIHREDLMADWRLAANGQTPLPIKPLE